VTKIGKVPFDQIGQDARKAMVSMNKMLANADKLVAQVNGDVAPQVLAALQDARRTLATANGALAPDASLQQDTRRMMQELTELPLRCARSPTISSGIPKRSCKEKGREMMIRLTILFRSLSRLQS
jgi:paraquat-inducible protein B